MPKRFITTEFYQELDTVISKMKYFFYKIYFFHKSNHDSNSYDYRSYDGVN